jgi:hypothetical protein
MNVDYSKYIEVCKGAVRDDAGQFDTFKRHPHYKTVLEHVTYQQGLEYLDIIREKCPELLKFTKAFTENDVIGNPRIFYYKSIRETFSPTTLRYIKVVADLIELFYNLDGMDIIEIGGGYGGQCKIIHDISSPSSYTIVDLPEAMALSKKYLNRFDINNVTFGINNLEKHYDLCISNYAFTEIDRKYQIMYAENIIKKSDKGYITCNFLGQRTKEESLSKDEILALRENYKVFPEMPMTAVNNLIYTWQ